MTYIVDDDVQCGFPSDETWIMMQLKLIPIIESGSNAAVQCEKQLTHDINDC
jgi:hypothetical protein